MPFTSKSWDGSAGRWPDAAAYCRSALIDDNPPGEPKIKDKCHLPIREPDGTYNVNAIRNALARVNQVQTSAEAKARATRRLRSLLAEAGGKTESRSVSLVDAEVKEMNFRGYAAVFDTPWDQRLIDETGYVEQVAHGAFRKALNGSPNVPLLWQHDRRDLLATTNGKTLRLKEDGKGLLVEARLPTSPLGAHVREMIERGDVQGMSYGIGTLPEDSTVSVRNGTYTRTINNVRKMIDVTLTWEPAYSATTVELRTVGFAALPLQALVGGAEAQTDDSAAAEDHAEADAWWEEDTSESAKDDPSRGVDLFIAEQLEKGVYWE